MNNVDQEYFRLLKLVLDRGRPKKSRAGDTIGVFGAQARFDLSAGFPILTTKKVHWPAVVHELLWFISGSTNIKYLVDNNVHIWDADCYRRYRDAKIFEGCLPQDCKAEFGNKSIDGGPVLRGVHYEKYSQEEFIGKIKTDPEFADRWGNLGLGTYGNVWREFLAYQKDPTYENLQFKGQVIEHKIDQLKKAVEKLKSNPDDRRIIVSAWHPYLVDHCTLPPCHVLYQFNTEELTEKERMKLYYQKYATTYLGRDIFKPEVLDSHGVPRRRLNCLMYQRSCDTFLGVPLNISSYSLLTCMVAHCENMVPGEFIHPFGDLHLYQNHIEQARLQLSRDPKPLPTLWLNPEIKDLFQFKYEDIRLEGYDPHPAIKAPLSVG